MGKKSAKTTTSLSLGELQQLLNKQSPDATSASTKSSGSSTSWADDNFVLPSAPQAMVSPSTDIAAPSAGSAASSSLASYGQSSHAPRGSGRFVDDSPRGRLRQSAARMLQEQQRASSASSMTISQVAHVDHARLPREPPFVCYVGNLVFDANEQDLGDFFGDSQIKNIRVITDRHTGRSKGFAYVEFATVEDLTRALMKSGQPLKGRSLNLDIADKKDGAPGTAGNADRYQHSRTLGPSESNRDWRANHQVISAPSPLSSQASSAHSLSAASSSNKSKNWRDAAKPVMERAASADSSSQGTISGSSGGSWRNEARPISERDPQVLLKYDQEKEQRESTKQHHSSNPSDHHNSPPRASGKNVSFGPRRGGNPGPTNEDFNQPRSILNKGSHDFNRSSRQSHHNNNPFDHDRPTRPRSTTPSTN